MATKKQWAEQEREEAKAKLLEWLKPGDTVHTILRHCSKSGMTRHIDMVVIRDGEPFYITWNAAIVMRDRVAKSGGLIVTGCGMDMGFSLVYNLGRYLWPDGFDLPEGERGRNGDKSGHDNDGGYALKHRWL